MTPESEKSQSLPGGGRLPGCYALTSYLAQKATVLCQLLRIVRGSGQLWSRMNASLGTDLQSVSIYTFVPECWLMDLCDSCSGNNSWSQDCWVKKAKEVGVNDRRLWDRVEL